MLKIILSRLGQGLIVLVFLYTATFFLVRMMPGDVFTEEKAIPAQALKEKRARFDLDKPLPTQFVISVKKLILQGDLRESAIKDQTVSKIIADSFPTSFLLGSAGMIIAICVGIPAGKVAGWGGPFDWILPSVTLGLATAAYLARITRAGMLDVLSQDYIRTAKAKGVTEQAIIIKHALKGGLIPAIAYIGPAFAMLITGSFIVETIFQCPGMGQHFINATKTLDMFVLQGIVLFFGSLIVLVNLLADIALIALNPRLR